MAPRPVPRGSRGWHRAWLPHALDICQPGPDKQRSPPAPHSSQTGSPSSCWGKRKAGRPRLLLLSCLVGSVCSGGPAQLPPCSQLPALSLLPVVCLWTAPRTQCHCPSPLPVRLSISLCPSFDVSALQSHSMRMTWKEMWTQNQQRSKGRQQRMGTQGTLAPSWMMVRDQRALSLGKV